VRNPADLLIHSTPRDDADSGIDVTPESAGWDYCGLEVMRLDTGAVRSLATSDDEMCIVPLQGSAVVMSGEGSWRVERPGTVFNGKPTALYLPIRGEYVVTADTWCELAITRARATEVFPPRLITPADIDVEIRGAGNAARQINHIIAPDFPAHRLLVVEVFTPSGNWSSYPPHKHDVSQMPVESDLEEIYYYRIQPTDGFGLQRLYTADGTFDHAWVIRDGDLLLVHEGYHAFVVAHGYTGYYLNVLAGDETVRTMQPSDDRSHAWVRGTWSETQNQGASSWADIDQRVNRGAGAPPR
jgi:5-deoxy-glucuronate isomerase